MNVVYPPATRSRAPVILSAAKDLASDQPRTGEILRLGRSRRARLAVAPGTAQDDSIRAAPV